MQSNQITPFCFGENVVRVFMDENGEPWFVAKDVCNIIGLENVSKAIDGLDIDEKSVIQKFFGVSKGYEDSDFNGLRNSARIINESGLYALIFRSNKPEAKKFSKWVRSEVLPALRKTGKYCLKGGKPTLDDDFMASLPPEALALRPTMRQKLFRDAIRMASLDSGGSEKAVEWFGRLCRLTSAHQNANESPHAKIRRYFGERLMRAQGSRLSAGELYADFRRWHAHEPGDLPSKKAFGETMREFCRAFRSNGTWYDGITFRFRV